MLVTCVSHFSMHADIAIKFEKVIAHHMMRCKVSSTALYINIMLQAANTQYTPLLKLTGQNLRQAEGNYAGEGLLLHQHATAAYCTNIKDRCPRASAIRSESAYVPVMHCFDCIDGRGLFLTYMLPYDALEAALLPT